MATFEIQGPDGKTYQVEAPDMQSAAEALGSFVAPTGGASVNQPNLERFESGANSALRGLAQGTSLRMNDEVMGAAAGLQALRRGQSPVDAYTGIRDQLRTGNAEAQQANPGLYGTGEVLGGVGVSLAAAPAATGATLLGTAGRGAVIGGIEGGLFGAGGADGRPVAPEAMKGAALGAALGGAAPAIVAGARRVGGVGKDMATSISGRASQPRANATMNRALARSGRTLDDIQAEAAAAGRAGQPEFALMDMLGSPGQRVASGVARSPGGGAREIAEFLQSRQLNAGDRTSGFLADGLGATDTAAQRQAALTAQRSADARVNYSAARDGAQPVDVRGALQVLDTRLGQTADMNGTGFTGDSIDGVFSKYRNRLAADRVPSDVDAIELSDFERVLGVKQDLGDEIGAAVRAGQNNKARELTEVSRALDEALEAASPGYRTANDQFAQASRNIEAVDTGASAAAPRVRADDAIDQFSAMTPDQQSAFRAGLGDRLIGKIENQAPGANVASPLMRTRTANILDEVANDPAKLRQQIARENIMAETRQRAVGGSRTADNLSDMDDVQNVDVGMLGNLLAGRFGTAGAQAGQKVANVASGRNEATNQLIARMLLSNDPVTALTPAIQQQARQQGQNRVIESIVRNAIARPSQ